jgi:presequence protease
MQSKVFPTTTYHHNSGGDPSEISRLSHEELLDFHQTFYHPSNSFSLTYGDLPLAPHLKFMNERALSKFTRRASPITMEDEKRYDKPVKVYVEGPLSTLSDPEKQNKIAVAWLTNNITEQFETSCMSLIGSLLLSGPNAPLYQALITSGLGSGFTAGSGYDSSYREAVFQVGLTNVKYSDVDKVEKTILSTLKEAAKTGFPQERIESLLHQLELGQRNVTTGFGIALIQGLTHVWMHGGSPIAALHFNDFLDRLKRELAADPQFFQKKIENHLLENKHRVTQVMVATDQFTKNSTRWEGQRLKKISHHLRKGEYRLSTEELKAQAKKLKHRQSKPDDVKVLPKLSLSEIDVALPKVEVHKESLHNGVPAHLIPQPTNGISYFYGKINLDGLPEHLAPYIPLFCTALTQTGAADFDYRQFAQQIEGTTGMFRAYHSIIDDPSKLDVFTPHIFFRSSALERNIPKMFDLWNLALQNPRFHDTQRLKTLIALMKTRMHDSLVDSGSSYAALYAASQISPLHRLKESWSGLSQYKLIQSLDSAESLEDTVAKLKEISSFVLKRNRLSVAINAEQGTMSTMQKFSSGFIGALSDTSSESNGSWWNKPVDLIVPKPTYLALPIQINYVANVLRGAPYTDPDFSKLDMMTSLLSVNFLHKEVREKGGAYGSGLGHNDGVLSFYSYRDPNVRHTLQAFASARDWLVGDNISDQQFEDAKLSLFGSLDSPVAPSAKGLAEFKYGLTHEMRQQRRERLMSVQKQDVVEMANKFLAPDRLSSVAVFGSASQGKEFEQDRNWIYRTD